MCMYWVSGQVLGTHVLLSTSCGLSSTVSRYFNEWPKMSENIFTLIIFSQVLEFWMGRFRTNISVFHLFLSGYMKALLLPKIITEIDVQWIEFFTRLSDWLACTLTNTYYMCMYKYIYMIITYITPLWQGTPRAFCVRSPQWVGAAGGRGYAPSRLRVP